MNMLLGSCYVVVSGKKEYQRTICSKVVRKDSKNRKDNRRIERFQCTLNQPKADFTKVR